MKLKINDLLDKYTKKYQPGNRLLLSVSALAIIVLIIGVISLPFNRGIFSKLFPKRLSHAATTTQLGTLNVNASGTLVNIQLAFTGDDNNNATATLEYKKTSDTNWTTGPALSRSAVQGVHTSAPAVKAATTSRPTVSQQPSSVPDAIIIKFKKEIPDEDRQALFEKYSLFITKTIQSKDGEDVTENAPKATNIFNRVFRSVFRNRVFKKKVDMQRVKIAPQNRDRVIQELRNNPDVEFAEADGIGRSLATPNDPLYATSQTQTYLPAIQAPAGWDISRGSSSITVAVLDSGVKYDHEDLIGKIDTANVKNMITSSTALAAVADDYGHGTGVASIVGSNTNNNVGIASLGWNTKILPIKVTDAYGQWQFSNVTYGIIWAADHGAKVINISLGDASIYNSMQTAVDYAWGKNVLVVAAAGNGGTCCILYPAANTHVIAAGAIDEDWYHRWSGTNIGPQLAVMAPGRGIATDYYQGGYGIQNATSAAAPVVSALAALIFSVNPALTPQQVTDIILKTADKVDSANYPYSDTTKFGCNGWNQYYGCGRINVLNALLAAQATLPSLSPTPTPTLPFPTNTPVPTATTAPLPTPTNTPTPTSTPTPLPTSIPTPTPVIFNNLFTAMIPNLLSNTTYDIRITVVDPDGIVGSGVVLGQITTGTASASSPFSLVNRTTATGNTPLTVTIPATKAGNLLVVCASNADGRSVSSVTDGSNIFTVDKNLAGSGSGAGIASAIQTIGGKTSVTVTLSGSSTFHVDVAEFSGNAIAGFVGTSSTGGPTSSQTPSVTSFSPTSGNLIVGCGGGSGGRGWSSGTNYTKLSTDSGNQIGASEYRLSSSGTETAPFSIDANTTWNEVAVEYKASNIANSPTPTPVPPTPLPTATPTVLTAVSTPANCGSFVGIGTVAWSNPANAKTSDDNSSSANLSVTTGTLVSNALVCNGYGFTIPSGAIIKGIKVSIERKLSNYSGTGQDASVVLLRGSIYSVNKASTTPYTGSDVVEDHGGSTDLWGDIYTPAQINAANFGVAFTATGNTTVAVDAISITVYYTP